MDEVWCGSGMFSLWVLDNNFYVRKKGRGVGLKIGIIKKVRGKRLQAGRNRHRSRQDDESAGSGSCYTKNGDLTDHKEADLTLLPLYRQPPHVVQSRYGIVGLAVGNGGFYVKTDQPTTNYRPLPKTIP